MPYTIKAQYQAVEMLKLKDGSAAYGFVSHQNPSNGVITFHCDYLSLVFPEEKGRITDGKSIDYESLNDEWKRAIDVTQATRPSYYMGNLKKSSIYKTHDDAFYLIDQIPAESRKVIALEYGYVNVAIVSCNYDITIPWDAICEQNKLSRNHLLLSGIIEEFEIEGHSGILVGTIVKQKPNQYVGILEKTGSITNIPLSKIKSSARKKKNPDQPLIEQAELLDIVETKDGVYEGVIIKQAVSVKDGNEKLVVTKADNSQISIPYSAITGTGKKPNPRYKPYYDVVLDDSTILCNRVDTAVMARLSFEDPGRVVVESIDSACILKFKDLKGKLVVECKKEKDISSYSLIKLEEFKSMVKKIQTTKYGFTYERMLCEGIACSSSMVTENGTMRTEYSVKGTGRYLLYNVKLKQGVLIEVI